MAKSFEPSGETVVKGKGAGDVRGGRQRGFPFRLLLWALLMTGAAGAGGYFAWTYREKWKDDKTVLAAEQAKLVQCEGERDPAKQAAAACQTQVTELQTAQKGLEEQVAQATSNLSATKEELTALRAQRAETEKRIASIEKIQAQFAKMIDTGELKVTSRRGNLVVELPSEVLFPSASAELSRKGEVAVLQVGGILKQFEDRRFLVVGHTDNQPLKSAEYKDNWELSVARALTVTRYLVEGGMKSENLIAAGAGENDPIADNSSSASRARNRRIEIALLPALSELPPLPASLENKAEQEAEKDKDEKKRDRDKKDD